MGKRRLDFKAWEILLLVVSAAVFAGALGVYVTGYPIRQLFIRTADEASQRQMGTLKRKEGPVRRQPLGHADFRPLDQNARIFNYDTVVTGPESEASIELEDGSTIELGPSTMVRVVQEDQLSLDGIARVAKVDVVAGDVKAESKRNEIVVKSKDKVVKVTAESKPQVLQASIARPKEIPAKFVPAPGAPKPIAPAARVALPDLDADEQLAKLKASPTPRAMPSSVPSSAPPVVADIANLRFTAPKNGLKYSVPNGSRKATVPVEFAWRVSPDQKVKLTILDASDPSAEEVASQVLPSSKGKGTFTWNATRPGRFLAVLSAPEQQPLTSKVKLTFHVNREFQAIEPLPPLVGGASMQSNRLQGKVLKDFDITLRWKEFPSAAQYRVKLLSAPTDDRAILERSVAATELVLNKDKAGSGKAYYRISARLPGGFVVNSPIQQFVFNFLPPELVTPAADAKLVRKGDETNVLLTWQKTNFTDEYEVEVSEDADFKDVFFRKRFGENFFIFRLPDTGKYWWRVRSYAKDFASPPSDPRAFTVRGK